MPSWTSPRRLRLVQAYAKPVEKEVIERSKASFENHPLFTNDVGGRAESVKKLLLDPLEALTKTTPTDPKTTAEQRKDITGLRQEWRKAFKELDTIQKAELTAQPDENEKKLMKAMHKTEFKELVKVAAKAEGEFWDSLSQNRDWKRQKLRDSWMNSALDIDIATAAARRALTSSAQLGNVGDADVKEKGAGPSQEAIFAEAKKFLRKGLEYTISSKEGVDTISTRNLHAFGNKKDEELSEYERNIKDTPGLSGSNPKAEVQGLLELAELKGYKKFEICTDNMVAARETLIAMYVNEKRKEAGKPVPINKLELTLTNDPPLNLKSYKDIELHGGKGASNSLLKGFDLALIERLGEAELKKQDAEQIKDVNTITKSARTELTNALKEEYKGLKVAGQLLIAPPLSPVEVKAPREETESPRSPSV